MNQVKRSFSILLLAIGISGCENAETDLFSVMSGDLSGFESARLASNLPKATGSVEFLWKGGEKGGEMGNQPEDLRAFFSFDAHVADSKGEIIYTVTSPDLTPHREIRAEVTGVFVDGKQAWVTAVVVSDTKGCGGDGHGGHDSNCSGSSGGCGDEMDGHDGGCSGDGTEEGGCSGGGMDAGGGSEGGDCSGGGLDEGCSGGGTDDGGCSGGDSDDGGCSGGGSGEEGNGSEGGSGSPDESMGNPLSGKNCRLGQIIAVKLHDKGTPGINGDVISWKWFSPAGTFIPTAENTHQWAPGVGCLPGVVKLCKKTIIEGNVVVHK